MLKIIAAPLLGGVIGYITNDLAIKMLFRPRKAVYIGKWHVPFTPGLIPSQKGRIAKSIGAMVSEKLLDGDTIRESALSEQAIEKLRQGVLTWLKENAGRTQTVREVLMKAISEEELERYTGKIGESVTQMAMAEMEKRNAGKLVTTKMLDLFRKKMQGMFFMSMLDDRVFSSLEEPMANAVNDVIRLYGPAILEKEIVKTEKELLDRRICDLCAQHTDKLEALADMLTKLYQTILTDYLDTLLRAANVSAIVEKKINSFSAIELEALIFGLMKKELSAIVYLGAALGFLMGFTNLLF